MEIVWTHEKDRSNPVNEKETACQLSRIWFFNDGRRGSTPCGGKEGSEKEPLEATLGPSRNEK